MRENEIGLLYPFLPLGPIGGILFAGDFARLSECDRGAKGDSDTDEGYVAVNGTIVAITAFQGIYGIQVKSDPYDTIIFNLNKNVFVFDQQSETMIDQSDLQVGMEVSVIMPRNAIMTMSIPPQTPSAVGIIVQNADSRLAQTAQVMYCGLQAAAREKGYRIERIASDLPIYLTKDGLNIELMIGSDEVERMQRMMTGPAARRIQQIEGPPIIYRGETLIPKSFADSL